MATVNLETSTDGTLYFPLNFYFRMIYNTNKLKHILPVKSDQSMGFVINGVMDSSTLPEIISFLKIFIMQWGKQLK